MNAMNRPFDVEMLKNLLRMAATTHEDELTCDICYEQVDRFADMVLAGRNAAEVLPQVVEHLGLCSDCREEFEALLAALRGVT
jgi:hypothetical protein